MQSRVASKESGFNPVNETIRRFASLPEKCISHFLFHLSDLFSLTLKMSHLVYFQFYYTDLIKPLKII